MNTIPLCSKVQSKYPNEAAVPKFCHGDENVVVKVKHASAHSFKMEKTVEAVDVIEAEYIIRKAEEKAAKKAAQEAANAGDFNKSVHQGSNVANGCPKSNKT